jgi:Tfp pilus tip-associated adhesin PilY1
VTVQTCSNIAAGAGNSYVSTSCAAQAGSKNQYQTQTRNRSDSYSGSVIVGTSPIGGGWPVWPSGDWVTTPASVPGAGWTDFSLCLGTVPADWAGWPAFLTTQPPPTDPVTPPSSFGGGCTTWPCTSVSAVTSGGSSNSLADVAQYYYKTDLRASGATGFNGADVSANKVFTSATDTTEGDMGKWQHMTTFTMGLGVSGNIAYNSSYKTKPVGSFQAAAGVNPVTGLNSPAGTPLEPFQLIRCQTAANAELSDPNLCLAWPLPVAATPTAVDDLWHAAVNGRGQYFSAADPDAVYNGLQTTLQAINAQSAAGTGATTSTQNPVPGNNLTFRAGFRTVDWTGDVVAQEIYTGDVLALQGTTVEGEIWSAQTKLGGMVGQACDNRNIYLLRMGATNNMVPFTWNSRACDGSGNPTGSSSTGLNATEQNFFASTGPGYTSPFPLSAWSQYINMSASQKTLAQGANLVNFVRGQRGQENFAQSDDTKLFRLRAGRLGDIVNSQPTFVPPPSAQFTDTGYSLFKSGAVGRTNMLYVGANDGMLHAFNATNSGSGGTEAWAIVPSPMLPNLYRLADTEYSEGHTYFVDSTPAYGDVFDKHATVGSDSCSTLTTAGLAKNCWKTILVGGYGAGGRGYYAMDITNPASPKALWEFNWSDTCYDSSDTTTHSADCHIGLSFGQPMITKLPGGTWVVLLPSGLNNVNSPAKAGDGKGYLYVLDAITGKIVKKISTGVGSAEVGSVALSGTLTLTATPVVTGSGTAFTTELYPGQTIVVNGETRTVQTITSNTQLSVSTAFAGSGSFAGTKTTTGAASFGHINAYVENYIQDNTAERVYGGDALGNVWRITLKGLADSTDDVVRLATLRDPSGNPQPITTAPTMMNVGALQARMVFVGTGRYLGESDLSDTQTQTVYGLVEDLTQTSTSAEYIANANSVRPASGLTLRQQLNRVVLSVASNAVETKVVDPTNTTITTVTTPVPSGTTTTTVTTYPTTPAAATTTTTVSEYSTRGASTPTCSAEATALGIPCSGWYVDLPETGERVNLDMRLVLGTLIVPTTVTNLTACDTGGNAWFNFLDAATGAEVPSSAFKAGRSAQGAIIVGVSFIRDKFGRIVAVLTKADGTQEVTEVPTQQGVPLGRRTGWRDLLGN